MSNVLETLREAQTEMRDKEDLPPIRASHLLNKLTSLIGNANTELRLADLAYKREKLQALNTHETANRATIAAETSKEYEAFLEAKHIKEEVLECVRSLKAYLKTAEAEMYLAR